MRVQKRTKVKLQGRAFRVPRSLCVIVRCMPCLTSHQASHSRVSEILSAQSPLQAVASAASRQGGLRIASQFKWQREIASMAPNGTFNGFVRFIIFPCKVSSFREHFYSLAHLIICFILLTHFSFTTRGLPVQHFQKCDKSPTFVPDLMSKSWPAEMRPSCMQVRGFQYAGDLSTRYGKPPRLQEAHDELTNYFHAQ